MHQSGHSRAQSMQTVQFSSKSAITPRLREWMWTVPAPPALDPTGEPAKEVTAARNAAGAEPPVVEEGTAGR